MAKKKIAKIYAAEEEPRILIGLACNENDHRVCWDINNTLSLQLSRENNITIHSKNIKNTFSCYNWFDEENNMHFALFSNKGDHGYMIESLQKINYFLLISGKMAPIMSQQMLNHLKKSPLIQGVFLLPANTIKASIAPF